MKKFILLTAILLAYSYPAYAVNPDDYIFQDFIVPTQNVVAKNTVTKNKDGYLSISATPGNADIKILNSEVKYSNGMPLKPGKYHISISSPGYKEHTEWVELYADKKLNVSVELKKKETKKHNPGDIWKDPTTGMEFIWIPGGSFMMGSQDGNSDELPVRKINLDGFWMSRYEVTNAQYRKYNSDHNSGENDGNSLNENSQPVVYVSWDDAVAYAKWLSSKGNGHFSLPAEQQWEYACRAGTTSKFSFGDNQDQFKDYAWFAGNSGYESWTGSGGGATHPVGQLKANSFGLYDMHGNVWEWVDDRYSRYGYFTGKDAFGNNVYRVLRGGGWMTKPPSGRSAARNSCPQGENGRVNTYGFRLVHVPE